MLVILAAVATCSPASGRGCRGTQSRCSWCSLLGGRARWSGVRFRTGQPGDVHLRALDGQGRPVAAVPDDGRRMVCDGGGLPPQLRGRAEIAMLMACGAVASCCTGFLMNPSLLAVGAGPGQRTVPVAGALLAENLGLDNIATRWVRDDPRAILIATTLLARTRPRCARLWHLPLPCLRRSGSTGPLEGHLERARETSSAGLWRTGAVPTTKDSERQQDLQATLLRFGPPRCDSFVHRADTMGAMSCARPLLRAFGLCDTGGVFGPQLLGRKPR